MALSEDMFKKLNKDDMWKVFSEMQNDKVTLGEIKADTAAVLARMSVTETRLEMVESELALARNSCRFLRNELARLHGNQLRDNQYGRLENVEACHRLGVSGTTIVRFQNRKHADAMVKNARKLKDLDLTAELGEGHSRVDINPNLCPPLKAMWAKARRMKEAGYIAYYGSNRRGVYVKTSSDKSARQVPVFVDSDFLQFLPDDVVLADVIAKK